MSKPGGYNLDLYRGDTSNWHFEFWTDEAHTVPLDLAGKTVHAELRDRPMGTKIVPLVVTVTDPNIVDLALELDVADLPFTSGSWDLRVSDATSRLTLLKGSVSADKDTTDST
jgi:hypothetical protein